MRQVTLSPTLPKWAQKGKGKTREIMKKVPKFDYEKFEKLQAEASKRAKKVNLNKFDKVKKSREGY